MKSIVIYITKHGTTKKVAEMISKKLGNATLVNLRDEKDPDICAYDQVVLGMPLYAGTAAGAMKTFCIAHDKELTDKKLGLFVCGLQSVGSKERETEMELAYTPTLKKHSKIYSFLGGELIQKNLTMAEKLIARMLFRTDRDIKAIDKSAIKSFVSQLRS